MDLLVIRHYWAIHTWCWSKFMDSIWRTNYTGLSMIRSNHYLRHNGTRMRLKKTSELSQSSILKLLFLQLLLKGLNRASRGMLDGGCWPLNRTDLRNQPSHPPIWRFVLGTRSDWSRHTATCYMYPGRREAASPPNQTAVRLLSRRLPLPLAPQA